MIVSDAADAIGDVARHTGGPISAEIGSVGAGKAETPLTGSTGEAVGNVAEGLADESEQNIGVEAQAACVGRGIAADAVADSAVGSAVGSRVVDRKSKIGITGGADVG